MTATWKIRNCYPVDGDWYCVRYDEDDRSLFIERIIFWSLVESEGEPDHIRPIMGHGHFDSSQLSDSFYVLGTDPSPMGPEWNVIYARSRTMGGLAMNPWNTRQFH